MCAGRNRAGTRELGPEQAGREVQQEGALAACPGPDSPVPAGTGWSGRRMGSRCHPGRAGGALPCRDSEGLGVRLRRRASVSPHDGAEQPGAGSAAGHPGQLGTPRCPLATRSGAEVTAAPPALHLPASSCFLHFLPEPFLARRCLCRCARWAQGEETPPWPWEGWAGWASQPWALWHSPGV